MDFDQIYTVVIKLIAFQVLFAIAAYFDLNINQIDVKTAFFYELINQLIYINLPKDIKTKQTKHIVCKLLKALYNLK